MGRVQAASVYSASRKKILWRNCLFLSTRLERMRGLMLAARVERPLVIEFPSLGRKRNALHSFFCPVFDAVFLDGKGVVVDVKRRLKHNSLAIVSSKPCKFVLELPPGEARRVRAGERLVIKRKPKGEG